MTLALTVLRGDADIYVNTYRAGGGAEGAQAVPLPTREDFKWRSMHYGDDRLGSWIGLGLGVHALRRRYVRLSIDVYMNPYMNMKYICTVYN